MKILIVVTLEKEKEALLKSIKRNNKLLIEPNSLIKKINIFNDKIKEDIEVGILELEQIGNIEAAIKTYRALSIFKPSLVILTGICGGFKKYGNLNLGDLIIPKQIIYYELGKVKKMK